MSGGYQAITVALPRQEEKITHGNAQCSMYVSEWDGAETPLTVLAESDPSHYLEVEGAGETV